MKKISSTIIALILLTITLSSCGTANYGSAFKSQEELKTELSKLSIELKYPSFFPNSDYEKAKFNYILNRNAEKDEDIGYKIYCFSKPFNSAMYGYNYESDKVESDSSEQLKKGEIILLDNIEIQLFEGTGHKNSLFIIGTANIDGKHYECRVVGDEATSDGESVNYIYKDNENYNKAIDAVKSMFQGLK